MVKEDNKALPCSGNESLLYKDTCQDSAEDTTCSVSWEDIQSIIDAGVRTPNIQQRYR